MVDSSDREERRQRHTSEGSEFEDGEIYFLQPGYIFASRESLYLNTVLGSCVAVAIWDSRNFFGGMCHFIYPFQERNARNAMYGDVAVPYLIRLMVELGATREDLKAHVAGGGVNIEFASRIGEDNAKVAEETLQKHKIEIVTLDVGGATGKRISFNTLSGELLVYTTNRIRETDWYR